MVEKKKFTYIHTTEYAVYAENADVANRLFSEVLEHQMFSDDIVRVGEASTRLNEVDDLFYVAESGDVKPVTVSASWSDKENKWMLNSKKP